MSDLGSNPDFFTHLSTSICFFIIFVIAVVQTIRLGLRNQFNKNRGAIHLCIAAAASMALMDGIGRMVYLGLYGSQFLMCFYPYVLVWYFIFTAYILALEMWIIVYNKVSKGAASFLRKLRITFIALDVALLVVLMAAAALWSVTTLLPDVLYVGALVVTAVGISLLFTIYGVKIAKRLGAGLRMQLHSHSAARDKHLYKITVQIIMLSVTCCSGAIIALVAKIVGIYVGSTTFNDVIKLLQALFELVMMLEMFYMVKPKSSREEALHPSPSIPLQSNTSTSMQPSSSTDAVLCKENK